MDVQFEIHGLEELKKRMKAIGKKFEDKEFSKAVGAGARVIRDIAKANAAAIDDPDTPESIPKNIAARVKKELKKEIVTGRVGVRGGAGSTMKNADKDPGGDTRHWRHVEFGTAKMSARPFMRPALKNNTQKATEAVVASLKKAVDKLEK